MFCLEFGINFYSNLKLNKGSFYTILPTFIEKTVKSPTSHLAPPSTQLEYWIFV